MSGNGQLAILGGTPVIDGPLPPYRSMGEGERRAVLEVMDSDCLSGFYGSPGPEFHGGPQIQAFEAEWRAFYGVEHAISVNSATSGLYAAIGALGIGPGDEVIVPPWTMSASVMAPLIYGALPVFADIEDETFGLDPTAVEAAVTPRTRAIVAVNLFGHAARLGELRAIADRHGLALIEDNAQAPLGMDNGRRTGSVGDIGVFSLNYHKHIHTGEGGICVTDDAGLAERLARIRNHAENVVDPDDAAGLVNMIGFNYRMTELSAAIGRVQLGDIERHVAGREALAGAVSDGLADLEGVTVPQVRDGCRHNYYCWTARLDEAALGVSRRQFSRALAAEGFPHATGYLAPLYELPVFKHRIAIGAEGYPFNTGEVRYETGMCPVTERLHRSEALLFEPCSMALSDGLADRLVTAFRKVHANRGELRKLND